LTEDLGDQWQRLAKRAKRDVRRRSCIVTLSYVEIYWLLAVTSALMFLLCFLQAKDQPAKGGDVAVH
jgi:hypothetical protein